MTDDANDTHITSPSTDAASDVEAHRPMLVRLAYRMLGSIAEAEDVVQDAFLRWRTVDRSDVAAPRAYLARVVSRLCLDRMKSASARREHYVGTWLPEPIIAPPSEQLANDLSVALLLTLERLSPLERAAFLLHDVFDMDYGAIADTLGRSEAACRQLAARAREHVRDERPRFEASNETRDRLTTAFHDAMVTGDVATIAQLLADDAILYSDGGGKRLAALNPIYGKDKILRFIVGIARKRALPLPQEIERTQLNGLPGFVLRIDRPPHSASGALRGPAKPDLAYGVETLALEIAGEQIVALYVVRNPDKLHHLE